MALRVLAILVSLALASCEANDGSYLMRGPGYDLNARRASATSSDLYAYMQIMCADAGLAAASSGYTQGCPNSLEPAQYRTLLQAGFNEINSGCKSYVQFVFEERMRENQFKTGNSAIQAFISGILTVEGAGARLFSYLVLSSASANAFYDAARIDPLQGMTVQNILKIISERQTAFETAVMARSISSRPQLVRVWREYQWICTPLAINSDFDALAAASIDGTKIDFDADAREAVYSITDTIAGVRNFEPKKGLKPRASSGPLPGSLGDLEKVLSGVELKVIQSTLCAVRETGFGPSTRAAINQWRRATSATALAESDLQQGLSTPDFLYLKQAASCASVGYKTAYERGYFYDDQARSPGTTPTDVKVAQAKKIAKVAAALHVEITSGTTRIEPALRAAVRKKREELNMSTGDDIDEAILGKLFE